LQYLSLEILNCCLNHAKAPVVIVGSEALQRADGGAVMSLVQQIADAAKAKVTIFQVAGSGVADPDP
jgi:hypothetical protein